MPDFVGVNHLRAKFSKDVRRSALPRTNTASNADGDHRVTSLLAAWDYVVKLR
jgi:hypothetical protein